MENEYEYDAFLAHNRKEKDSVVRLAKELRESEPDVRLWLDSEQIAPGDDVNVKIDHGLRTSRKILVILGPSAEGGYQRFEMGAALEMRERLIPVYLPGFDRTDAWAQLWSIQPARFERDVTERGPLDALLWGMTGRRPGAQPPPTEPAITAEAAARSSGPVDTLVKKLRLRNIAFYVGSHVPDPTDPNTVTSSDVARALLRKLNIIDESYTELLPPADVAALLYAVREGHDLLDAEVVEQLGVRADPKIYATLMRALALLASPQAKEKVNFARLVFTTNFDLLLERAFIEARIPFTRIVLHCDPDSGRCWLHVNEAAEIPEGANPATLLGPTGRKTFNLTARQPSDGAEPADKLVVSEFVEPVLFKFHGSEDVERSCAISIERYFDLGDLHGMMPSTLNDLISNTSSVLIGFSAPEPTFQQVHRTFLRHLFRVNGDAERYLVQPPPDATTNPHTRMEAAVWPHLAESRTLGDLKLVDTSIDTFMGALCTAIANWR